MSRWAQMVAPPYDFALHTFKGYIFKPDFRAIKAGFEEYQLILDDAKRRIVQPLPPPPPPPPPQVAEQALLSFIESPFTSKVEYERWRDLPPEERADALERARSP